MRSPRRLALTSTTLLPTATTMGGGNLSRPRHPHQDHLLLPAAHCSCMVLSQTLPTRQKLLAAVDTDGSGHIHEDEWVEYFEKHTPANRAKFDLLIEQFVEVSLSGLNTDSTMLAHTIITFTLPCTVRWMDSG